MTPEPTLTPTPPPSVGTVNGVYIAVEDLDREIANITRAAGDLNQAQPEDARAEALDLLTDQALLIAYAQQHGYQSDSAEIDERIHRLIAALGSEAAFTQWKQENHYSDDGFRRALDAELAVGFARSEIFAEKLAVVEQVHAYQILTSTKGRAQEFAEKLALGFDFITQARNNDTISGGDLDWIARGVLVYPELEEALFALEPGQFTDVIETEIGFHILFAAEKSSDRPLSQQSREIVEHRVIRQWLDDARGSADIRLNP